MSRMRFAASALLLAGCVGGVGNGPPTKQDAGDPDAPKVWMDARPSLGWVDAAMGMGSNLPCENNMANTGDGRHNPGKSCFQNCHNHGFTMAGTLYTNATGNTGFSGATITVIDANNVTRKYVTYPNGNFYTRDPIAFPALVMASSCPSAVKMNASVTNGNCNVCHLGASNEQMHLP